MRFRPVPLAYSTRIVLQTIYDSSVFQVAVSCDFVLQRVLIELLSLIGQQDLLAIQGYCGFLDAQ